MRPFLVFAALTALATPGHAIADAGPSSDGKAVIRATELLRQHQPDQALEVLKPIVTSTQAGIAAARSTGLAYCARDMVETILYSGMASAAKKNSTVFGPDQCMALYLTAFALNEKNQSAAAATLLQQLVELSPANAQYAIELGFTLRTSGDNAKARAAYEQALAAAELTTDAETQKAHRAAARRGLGYLLIEAGDLDGAEAMYRKSQDDDPNSPVAKAELDFIRQQRARKPAT